jgi:hypothetical protein
LFPGSEGGFFFGLYEAIVVSLTYFNPGIAYKAMSNFHRKRLLTFPGQRENIPASLPNRFGNEMSGADKFVPGWTVCSLQQQHLA